MFGEMGTEQSSIAKVPRGRTESGFTLLEIAFAMSLFLIGFMATSFQIVTDLQIVSSQREEVIAIKAAQGMLDQIIDYQNLQSTLFSQTFQAYNGFTGDDPVTVFGSGFAVNGLQVQAGDADGFAGRIRFPVDPNNAAILREDIPDGILGMPRDLNGDGGTDGNDHSGDYVILPVSVIVEWRSIDKGRNRSVELPTIIVAR